MQRGEKVMTTSADRVRAEAGIVDFYQAAGRHAPQIMWCESAFEVLRGALHPGEAGALLGPWLNKARGAHIAADEMERQFRDHILRTSSIFWGETIAELAEEHEPQLSRYDMFREVRHLFWSPVWTTPVSWPEQAARPGWSARVENVRRMSAMTITSMSYWTLARERACWIVPPPLLMKWNRNGQLHSEQGPALRIQGVQQDFYYWHGHRVAQHLVEQPEAISWSMIDAEPDAEMKRIMIECMGIERFMREAKPERRHRDRTGTLWRKRLTEHWMDTWQAVEVVNGTAEPDGTHRRYFLQVPPWVETAREAVAWTYGLEKDEYRVSMRT